MQNMTVGLFVFSKAPTSHVFVLESCQTTQHLLTGRSRWVQRLQLIDEIVHRFRLCDLSLVPNTLVDDYHDRRLLSLHLNHLWDTLWKNSVVTEHGTVRDLVDFESIPLRVWHVYDVWCGFIVVLWLVVMLGELVVSKKPIELAAVAATAGRILRSSLVLLSWYFPCSRQPRKYPLLNVCEHAC